MIILYTSKNCKYCPEVKEFLVKNYVIFEVKDIGEGLNRDELVSMGGRGVPSIIVDNNLCITGKDDIIQYILDNELQ